MNPVEGVISNREVEAVRAISLSRDAKPDCVVWPCIENGEYIVKSGYHYQYKKLEQTSQSAVLRTL